MAVEARHLNLFSPQFIGTSREIMNPIEGNAGMYNYQMQYAAPFTAAAAVESLIPLYGYVNGAESIAPHKAAAIKSESTLTTYNNNIPVCRKRPRDQSINPLCFPPSPPIAATKASAAAAPFSFLGHDISLQIQQQQLDTDRLVSHHMEKVRIEIEEKRKKRARIIMEAIEGGMMKKLQAKEDEIAKIGKLNFALEERVKSLRIENQIWRELAQSNEATANALRSNLEQVLASQMVKEEQLGGGGGAEDDAESCCGSGGGEEDERAGEGGRSRMCRNCLREESCVLLLPCRHLCLCTVCGSNSHVCPVCKSAKSASVHVNMA